MMEHNTDKDDIGNESGITIGKHCAGGFDIPIWADHMARASVKSVVEGTEHGDSRTR